MYLSFVLAATLVATLNAYDVPGPCPIVRPVHKFDINRFSSTKWFVAEHTDNDRDRCLSYTMTPPPSGTSRRTGVESDGDLIDKTKHYQMDTPGVFTFFDKRGDRDDYVVVAIDDDYAVVYYCDYDRKDDDHEEEVQVLVKEDLIHDDRRLRDAVYKAKGKMASSGVGHITTFYPVQHEHCEATPRRW